MRLKDEGAHRDKILQSSPVRQDHHADLHADLHASSSQQQAQRQSIHRFTDLWLRSQR